METKPRHIQRDSPLDPRIVLQALANAAGLELREVLEFIMKTRAKTAELKKAIVALSVLFVLGGCGVGEQKNRLQTTQGAISSPVPSIDFIKELARKPLPSPAVSDEPRAEVVEVPADVDVKTAASNNANQQSVSGVVGAQIAKLAENLDASLLRVESRITATNEINAKFQNEMRAEANLHASAVATLRSEFTAKMEAVAQVQAGLGNKIESNKAGRDVVQYESTKPIIAGFVAALVTIIGGAWAMLRDKEKSRDRSERRSATLLEQFIKGKNTNEKHG